MQRAQVDAQAREAETLYADDEERGSATSSPESSEESEECPLFDTDSGEISSQSDGDDSQTESSAGLRINLARGRPPYSPRRQRSIVRRFDPRQTASGSTARAAIALANQVEALRRRRDELAALYVARLLNTDRRDFVVTTALEYYDTFSDGFLAPRLPRIVQYMDARIDRENFAYGASALSLDTWVEQWHRYTRMFPSIAIRVRATSCSHLIDPLDASSIVATDSATTTCMVEARGMMTGVISRQAIDTLLPHLRHRADLVHKLLHKPLLCPIALRFYFNATGRIIRLDLDADFFQAFCNVANVGLLEVAHMMEHMTVGECSLVPEVVERDDDQDDSVASP
jgi:hypothetical protein